MAREHCHEVARTISFGLYTIRFLQVSTIGQRMRTSPEVPFVRTHPFMKAPLVIWISPKASFANAITLAIRISACDCESRDTDFRYTDNKVIKDMFEISLKEYKIFYAFVPQVSETEPDQTGLSQAQKLCNWKSLYQTSSNYIRLD